jgi:hypothetical protein
MRSLSVVSLAVALALPGEAWCQAVNPDFEDGLNGWSTRSTTHGPSPGSVVADSGDALLVEGDSFLVVLSQRFDLLPRSQSLSFTYTATWDEGIDAIPDAFEARLLDDVGTTLVDPWELGNTAWFNLQETGVEHLATGVTVDDVTPRQVTLDLQGVDGTVTLAFSLVGGDTDTLSEVRIHGVDIAVDNAPPVAVAADVDHACGSGDVTLDGSESSDPNGDPLAYSWVGPDDASGSDATLLVPEPPLGNHVYTLTVTDQPYGASSSTTATIRVTDTDGPIADAVPADVVLEEDGSCADLVPEVALTGTDACGGAVTRTQDPPSGTALDLGDQDVTLTLTDERGNTTDVTVTVSLVDSDGNCSNNPPLAEAGGPYVHECGSGDPSLDGSASSDPDGNALLFTWTDSAGAPVGDTAVVTVAEPALGDHPFTLTVADQPFGLTDDDTAVLTVVDSLPPLLTPPTTQTLEEDGSCADLVPDLAALASADDQCTGSVAVAQDPPAGSVLSLGTTAVTLTATDASGNAASATVDVVLVDTDGNCSNNPPVADAGGPYVHECGWGDPVLDGSGSSDPDGNPLEFLWTDDSGAEIGLSERPTIAEPALGTHDLQLAVSDVPFGLSDVDTTTITVSDTQPPALVPATPAPLEEDGSCTAVLPELDADLTDACDGAPTRAQDPPAGTALPLGQHLVSLTATDASGNAVQTDVVVEVVDTDLSCANQPPVADAGADQEVSCEALPALLDGSGSSDPEGEALSFSWTEGGAELGTEVTLAVSPAVGTHAYTLAVTDPEGLSDLDVVSVTVVDDVAPSFVDPPTALEVPHDGTCTAALEVVEARVEDGCTPAVLSQAPEAGTVLELGDHDLVLTATDGAGNTTTHDLVVTVVDPEGTCDTGDTSADTGDQLGRRWRGGCDHGAPPTWLLLFGLLAVRRRR